MNLWKELFPNGDATEFSTFIFDTFDLNVNGSIEFDEFIQVSKFKFSWFLCFKNVENMIFEVD